MHPSIVSLQLHYRICNIVFHASQNLINVLSNESRTKTMLTEFFQRIRSDSNARHYLYHQFPKHYVWHHKDKFWSQRKSSKCIGRIVAANPVEGECYFLRLLLLHVKSPTSFEYLCTINGKSCGSFWEAAEQRDLLESDISLEDCLAETSLYQMHAALR